MSTNIVVTTEADVTVIETPAVESQVIVTAGAQGPAGRDGKDGIDGSSVSSKPKNRLTKEADGLYVSDDLLPDPLAYYILAKN